MNCYEASVRETGIGRDLAGGIITGLTLWAIGWGLMGVTHWLSGMITLRIALLSVKWGIAEVPVAILAGAWAYRECGQQT